MLFVGHDELTLNFCISIVSLQIYFIVIPPEEKMFHLFNNNLNDELTYECIKMMMFMWKP